MSANTAKIQSVIENTFLSAIKKLEADHSANLITDLYIQADPENGELQIYDDGENLIEKVIIFDWIKSEKDKEGFNQQIISILKAVLKVLSTKEVFNSDCFMRPLSVSLTDDDFVVIEELLFLDDEMLRLDDPLLKDLDIELDNFLNELLSDLD